MDVETLIRRLAVEPVKSVNLNSHMELVVVFENERVVKEKYDAYFMMFMTIVDKLERIEKIYDAEDERMFVPDPNPRFSVFGLRRGDLFKSVRRGSTVEFFTRLS